MKTMRNIKMRTNTGNNNNNNRPKYVERYSFCRTQLCYSATQAEAACPSVRLTLVLTQN